MSDHPIINSKTETDPKEPVRAVLERLDLAYEEDDNEFITRLRLTSVEGTAILSVDPGQKFTASFRFPMLAPPEVRPAVGEFLHRMNYSAGRMCWDMDYSDGEVRCRLTTDLFLGPLNEDTVGMIFKAAVMFADATSPYLAAVMTRAMKPEFASDQAVAAIESSLQEASE